MAFFYSLDIIGDRNKIQQKSIHLWSQLQLTTCESFDWEHDAAKKNEGYKKSAEVA